MTIQISPFLRKVLVLDAATSGVAAIAMSAGAGLIASLTGLPGTLLFWAGIILLPWSAALAYCASRPTMPRMVLTDIAIVNAVWVAASVGLLFGGLVTPNMLGVLFVLAQASAVLLFALLQFSALRPASARAA